MSKRKGGIWEWLKDHAGSIMIMSLLLLVVYLLLGVEVMPFNQTASLINKSNGSSVVVSYIQANHVKQTYTYDYTNGGTFCVHNVDYGIIYGSSMNPSLWDGNTVIEQKYTGQELKQGMFIRYASGEDYVIHIIGGVYPTYVLTTNYRGEEEEVPYAVITHIVVGVIFT